MNRCVRRENNRRAGTIKFMLITTALILITAFFMAGTVKSQSKDGAVIEAKYYDEMESQYIKDTKSILEAYGFSNSGITMTRVSDSGKERDYKVVIYNRDFKWQTKSDRDEMYETMKKIVFPAADCYFFHEFVADKNA